MCLLLDIVFYFVRADWRGAAVLATSAALVQTLANNEFQEGKVSSKPNQSLRQWKRKQIKLNGKWGFKWDMWKLVWTADN